MASFASSTFLLILSSSLLLVCTSAHSLSAKRAPLALPLRTQKVSTFPAPRRKLLFRHNVSLTVSLSVGTPPQNVSMVLDTGSELSWLLCNYSSSSSSSSSSSPQAFHPRSSASYSPVPCSSRTCQYDARDLPVPAACGSSGQCHVSLSYADASTSEGALAADTFLVGAATRAVFGCMSSAFSSSAGDPGVVGLLGMNRGALSFVTQTSTRRFSYCIPAGGDAASSGVLLLGSADDLPFLLNLNYTPLIEISLPLPYFDRVAYSVQLEGIRVAGELLPIPKSVLVPDHTGAGQTIVDSGTQFTFLLGPAYEALKIEFLRRTKGILAALEEPDFAFEVAFDACFRLPAWMAAPPVAGIPAVALVLRGAEVAVQAERLLYRVAGERRGADAVWCLTFGNADLVPMEAYVIGHHHQQDLWVDYDLDRARVGFGPVRCDLASKRLIAEP